MVGFDALMTLLWALLALLYVSRDGLKPVSAAIVASFLAILAIGISVRVERILESEGEYRASRRTPAIVILAGAAFLVVLFAGVIPALSGLIVNEGGSVYLGIVVAWATRLALVLRWERKTKKRVYVEGTWVGRFYLVPPGPLQSNPSG